MIRIGIITAQRKGGVDTLSPMLRSMQFGDPIAQSPYSQVGVFADEESIVIQEPWVNHIETRGKEELASLRAGKYFGSANLARALRWAASEGAVVVASDDDFLVAQGWLSLSICLLEKAKALGIFNPVIALGHFYNGVDAFNRTEIYHNGVSLWSASPRTRSNGIFPVVMYPEVALAIAPLAEDKYLRNEQDYAILEACRADRVGTLLYTDPCLSMHMNMASHFVPATWDSRLLDTKRFRGA